MEAEIKLSIVTSFFTTIAFLLICPHSLADDTKSVLASDFKVLRALKTVSVLVEHLAPETEADGLSTHQIQTDVELRLREAGINVIDIKEANKLKPNPPYLYINVNCLKLLDESRYVVAIQVEMAENATLERHATRLVIGVTTWSRGFVGIFGQNVFSQSVRQEIRDKVDAFLNDYLKANQKKQ